MRFYFVRGFWYAHELINTSQGRSYEISSSNRCYTSLPKSKSGIVWKMQSTFSMGGKYLASIVLVWRGMFNLTKLAKTGVHVRDQLVFLSWRVWLNFLIVGKTTKCLDRCRNLGSLTLKLLLRSLEQVHSFKERHHQNVYRKQAKRIRLGDESSKCKFVIRALKATQISGILALKT